MNSDPKFYRVTYSRKLFGSEQRLQWRGIITAKDYENMKLDTPDTHFGYIILDAEPATQEDWDEQYKDD